MKLAIDFGTSYCAAAVINDGEIELISFGEGEQLRTSVFFPAELPSVTDFRISPEIAREIAQTVQKSKSDQTREFKRLDALRQDARKLPPEDRNRILATIPNLKVRSDEDLYKEAVDVARRNWLTQQTQEALSGTASMENAIYGEEAIDTYLQGKTGHLVSSPKSMLGFNLAGRARSTLTGVTSKILTHIKRQAELQTACRFDELLLGRPVRFKSSLGESGTHQAIDILQTAALAAGFTSVDFLEEPAAASWHVHKAHPAKAVNTLIVDVGGGTTDLAYGLIGGEAHKPAIKHAWGMPKGGTDIDIDLCMRSFMTAFGKNQHNIPNHIFYQAASAHDLARQREFSNSDMRRYPKPYSDRLSQLQEPGATVRLNRAVERTKIYLSEHDRAEIRLEYIEKNLTISATRAELEDSCELFLNELTNVIRKAASESQNIELVYLTGGSSRAPYVASTVQKAIGSIPLIVGDASYAVINGLAHAAAV